MSTVRPFRARVVRQEHAGRAVTALTESLAESDLAPPPAEIDPEAYDDAGQALYVYRQRRDGVGFTGLVCEVAVTAFAEGLVRGHEAVQPQRVEALVRHQVATAASPALVTLLHHAGPAFLGALDGARRTAPLLEFTGPGGYEQAVWRVPDGPVTGAVVEELSLAQHYIADGHHRVAAAIEEWRLAGKPDGAGLLCVVHAMGELGLSAFHRRIAGPVQRGQLLALLDGDFRVREVAGPPEPVLGTFGLYVDRRWHEATFAGSRADRRAGLDVSILHARVLDRLPAPAAGSADPRTVEIAPARTPVAELTERCDRDGGALFTLAPPPLEALTRIADAGEVMPPKTTYFEPKPCAGIFLRPST